MSEIELEAWVERLITESMPIFTRTARSVAGTASRENSSFSELTGGILQDPTLTAQILKVSNGIYYNPCSKRINTVSRAVMRLGFETVKAMCLSIALVETVLGSLHRERVALEIARAFHAAVQAKKLAEKRCLKLPEEVFIAALLSRIGQIAFWCFAGEIGDDLEAAIEKGEQPEVQSEIEVLGFRLERLTLRLCHEWKLSDLLESMLANRNGKDPRAQSIRLGYRIAQTSEQGWDSPTTKSIIREIGEFLKIPEQEATHMVLCAARDAADITESFGAKKSSRLIPLPAEPVKPVKRPPEEKGVFPEPDLRTQIGSLRDLSALMACRKGDVNVVLSILLEGIYRGIGMDRVIFALLAADRQSLKGKHGLGWMKQDYVEGFRMSTNPSQPNIFCYVLKHRKPVWITEDPPAEIFSLLTKELSDMIGSGPFFAMPISIKGQPIGVVYGDRNPSGRELDEESFENFAFFGQQANMSLEAIAGS